MAKPTAHRFTSERADRMDRVVDELRDRGGLFVVSHSGGKDSMAQLNYISSRVPREQIFVIHAILPEVEWDRTAETARDHAAGFEYAEVSAAKTFFEMVERRHQLRPDVNPWPTQTRQCTSDLKRNPIRPAVRKYADAHGFDLIVDCQGLRAEEGNRGKKLPLERVRSECNTKRSWYRLLPIHHVREAFVWASLEAAGDTRHWIYETGMERCSCCFCIYSSPEDLTRAAKLNPELYRKFVELERRYGKTFSIHNRPLVELTGIDL